MKYEMHIKYTIREFEKYISEKRKDFKEHQMTKNAKWICRIMNLNEISEKYEEDSLWFV
jgi:hypothetical protein